MIAEIWDGKPISKAGIIRGLPIETYHGDCCDGPSISSSGLRTIWSARGGPAKYWSESIYNPLRIEREDKDYFALGSAAHMLLLGEPGFRERFSVRPPEWRDYRTNAAKAWRDAERAAGKTVITPEQMEQIRGMAGLLPWQQASSGWSVPESGLANSEIGRMVLEGAVEHSIMHRDPVTGIWIKARPDVIPHADRIIADFKTTSVDPDKAVWEHHYPMQGALIADALTAVTGERGHTFVLVFIATTAPFTVSVREISADDLQIARRQNRAALDTFARCLERREWPAADGEPRRAKMPSWYESQLNAANDRGELPVLEMEAAE